ncbi:MAG: EAL domain-containing protein [Motiliproteus sp.]
MTLFTPLRGAVFTFVVILCGVWFIDSLETQRFQQAQRSQIVKTLATTRAKLEASISERLGLVEGLAAFAKTFIAHDKVFSKSEFENFSRELMRNKTGIRSLQLQPNAVVRYVYPSVGNESVIGHDLLADPSRRDQVLRAIREKSFPLIGPISLIQGGKALIGRYPIYRQEGEGELFWGFAAILLDLDPLFQDAGLLNSDSDVIYALKGRHGLGAGGEVFFGQSSILKSSLTSEVLLPSGSWQLAAIPVGGWVTTSVRQWWMRALGLLLALLAAGAVYVQMRSPHKLQELVAFRTLEYQKTLAELQQEKAMVNSIIDSVPDLIFCKNLEGRYIRCNSAFEQYIGQSRERLFNRSDDELIFDDMPAHFHELNLSVLRERKVERAEEWVTKADGKSLLLDTVKVPFCNAEGELIGMIGVSRDSTERRWGEKALLASEKKFRALIEGLDEVLFRISLKTQQYEFVSSSAVDIFGYEAKAFTDNNDFMKGIIHPESRQEHDDYWRDLVHGKPARNFRYSILDKFNKQRWLTQSARVVRDEQGAPIAVEGICADITESLRYERILKTISKGVSGALGEQFFHELVKYMATSLDVEYAVIASLNGDCTRATSVAAFGRGQAMEKFSYNLGGTPCEEALTDGVCIVEKGSANKYPDDKMLSDLNIESYVGKRLVDSQGKSIGIILMMDSHPLKNVEQIIMAMDIFAVRASAELERADKEQTLLKISRAVEQSPTGVLITNVNGEIEYANDSFCAMTGYTAVELLGQNPRILKSGKQDEDFYKDLWSKIRSGEEWHGELQNVSKDGAIYWAKSSIYPISTDGGETPSHFVALKENVTEKKRKDARLNIASTVFDTTSEAIIVTNSDNRIQLVNPAFTRISGYEAEEVLGKSPGILSSGRHDGAFYKDMNDSLERTNHWEGEIWNRRKNGEVFPEWLSIVRVLNKLGEVERFVAIFSDISKRKEAEGQLYRQANFDALTELPNRMLATDRLTSAITRGRRLNTEVAVIHLGLDRFKWVNDTYGHDAGDAILQLTADRLSHVVRDSDTVARLNGDEFLIILPDIGSGQDAEFIASSICHRIAKPYSLEQGEAYLTASIGIALFPSDAETVPALLHHADSALGRAKGRGGDVYRFYTAEMNKESQERAELEVELRQAIVNEEFELYFQPLIDIGRGCISGAESLIRWNHPTKGLRMPGEFIPLAEKTGLIIPMGKWVVQQACAQLNAWQQGDLAGMRLSVNMSPKQCSDSEGFESIRTLIRESGIDTDRLVVEITETLLMEGDSALNAMNQLKDMGIKLSMDDFGTGYSSLSYLKRFPIDYLKIDRGFIQDLPNASGDSALVEAIVSMAHGLNLLVVAEGVETLEQSQFLENLGCQYLQGYYYGKPMPVAAFEQLVADYALPVLAYTGPDNM